MWVGGGAAQEVDSGHAGERGRRECVVVKGVCGELCFKPRNYDAF